MITQRVAYQPTVACDITPAHPFDAVPKPTRASTLLR